MRKPLTLDDLADVLTLKEAADAVGMTETTLRVNIKSGELRAFLPRGKDPKHAKLSPEKKYRLEPGRAGIYQDGKIHSIDYPDKSRFVRVTGVNLDNINRISIDLKTGAVKQMTPQQAT